MTYLFKTMNLEVVSLLWVISYYKMCRRRVGSCGE